MSAPLPLEHPSAHHNNSRSLLNRYVGSNRLLIKVHKTPRRSSRPHLLLVLNISQINVRAVDSEIGALPGAQLHTDGYDGQAKIVVNEDRHIMVGATFIGPQVGDLLHAATIAIVGQVPLERLWHVIPSFPTVNEVWIILLEKYGF